MNPSASRRAKVCHLICDSSEIGGGPTFALSTFPAYLADFEVFAIVGSEGKLAERLRERGVRTRTLPMGRPWKAFLFWPWLWALLLREKPDAVILHGQWGGLVGSVAARLAGIRAILYYTHFPFFYTDWDFYRVLRNRVIERVTCFLATKVICLSAANRYQYLLRRLAPEEKFIHIPNGLAPMESAPEADPTALRRELGLPPAEEGPIVVSVSRLSDQKRIDWLLRAWATVEQRFPAARLFIVGSGPTEEALRALSGELGLERCRFLGRQPKGYRYYRVADLGVICSLYEGHPLALIEAMFCGCPMVGCAVDGIAETIEADQTGLLVSPADPEALAAAILELLSDPARARRMGEEARTRAEKLYRLNMAIERQIQVLRAALRDAGKPN